MAGKPKAVLERLANRLSDKEKFCLDAYLVNKDRTSAYVYSRKVEPSANENSLSVLVSRWINSEPVDAYLELSADKLSIPRGDNGEPLGEADQMFERIVELLTGFANDNSDKKLALQAAKELGNLYQLKGKSKEEAEQHKVFYLPLRCYDCKAYQYAKENAPEGKTFSKDYEK